MKLKKSMLLAGVVTTVAAGSLLGISAASADTANGSSNIIDKLVEKFNLNRDDVQAVFDEERSEQQAERSAEFSDQLQQKVDDGDITAEQKTLIEQKFSEIQTAHEAERTALQQWADDNGIDMKYLMGGHGRMGNSTYIDDAVSDGKLTEDQKTLIEQKRDELETARESARDELKQWAEDNDIDLQDVMPFRGMGGHGRGGMMGDMR